MKEYKIIQIIPAPEKLIVQYNNSGNIFEEKIVAVALIEWNDTKEREIWYVEHGEDGKLSLVEDGVNYELVKCYFK